MKYDIQALSCDMKKRLKLKRYVHSVGVMYTAQAIAMRYGQPLEDAAVAGILHDCAKEMGDNELYDFCISHEIDISEDENIYRYLLHSKVGSYIAKHRYGVEDENIIDAIRYHTTGKENMTMLQKIIYAADYIEPHRKTIFELDIIRKETFTDIDYACKHILKNTVTYLQNEGRHVDEYSLRVCQSYKTAK